MSAGSSGVGFTVQPIVVPPTTRLRGFDAAERQAQVTYPGFVGPCGAASSDRLIGAPIGTTTSRVHRAPASPFTRITSTTDVGPAPRFTLPVRHELGSFTVTWNEHDLELPDESLAVQLTVVVPKPNVVPDAGVQMIVGLGSIASDAVTE